MDRSSQPPNQPTPASLTPQPNQILATPATVETCRADYNNASDVRQTMAQQEAKERR